MGCVPYYHLIRHLDDVGNGGDTRSLAYESLAVHLFFGGLQTDDLDFKEFSTKNIIRLDTEFCMPGGRELYGYQRTLAGRAPRFEFVLSHLDLLLMFN